MNLEGRKIIIDTPDSKNDGEIYQDRVGIVEKETEPGLFRIKFDDGDWGEFYRHEFNLLI